MEVWKCTACDAVWSKFQSLTFEEANIAMKGNIEAGVGIGIDAKEQARQAFSIPLAEGGPPGFSVSGVFIVGPFISLKAEADLGISLQGQVLAGANVSIPNFYANLDLVNQEKSVARGFTPQLKRIFEAKARAAAHADFGLPISVGVGLIVPKLKFEETVKITNKPSVQADMTHTASTTCVGLQEDDTFINDLYVDFFGKKKFGLYNVTIPIVAKNCIRFGGPSSCASSTTLAPAATDAFGDPIIDYFKQPHSDYLAANSFIGADPLVAAVPTDASGNPLHETKNVYAAVDTLANYYFLAICNIQGQASKIFLVANENEALETLRDEQLRYTVTGGVVDVCYFISWTQPPSPDAIQPGDGILPFIEAAEANRTSGTNGTNGSSDSGNNTSEGSDNGNTSGDQNTDTGDTQAGGGETNTDNSGSTDNTGSADNNSGNKDNSGNANNQGNTDSAGNTDNTGNADNSGNTDDSGDAGNQGSTDTDNSGNADNWGNADNTDTGGESTNTGDTGGENNNADNAGTVDNSGNADNTNPSEENTATDNTGNTDGQNTNTENTATD
ncbi:MAG: hypothetical protein Q9205_002597 [Flavoplaca limonia]